MLKGMKFLALLFTVTLFAGTHDRIWDVLVTDNSQWLIGTDVRYGMNPEDAKISDFVHGDAQ